VSGAKHSERAETLRRYKPYPAYKESGVEWLGEIPVDWQAKRLRFSAELNPPASETRGLPAATEVSFVPMEAVGEYGGLDLTKTKALADVESGYTYFRDADVVVAKITPCFENGKGARAAGLANRIALGTTELHVLRATRALDADFLFYLTLSDAFRRLGEAEMYGAGGQKRVPESFIEDLRHPLPPTGEQRAIAQFLDRETARIDALVAKKDRLIELLQERRTALITRAVTRGLDPDIATKDSGVEWLREIPAHWEVKRIRDIAQALQTGPFGSQLHANEYVLSGCPVINPANLRDGRLVPDEECTVDDVVAERLAHHRLQEGDILFARRGELGRCGLVTSQEEGWLCGTGCLRLRAHRDVARPSFLIRLLSTTGVADWLDLQSVGATMKNLNTSIIGLIPLPVPPTKEQETIAAFLDRETTRIDALVTKVRNAIEGLKELRIALISAAVTGKIDVRRDTVSAAAAQGGAA
jgi:type I restriction enzyme S subunit